MILPRRRPLVVGNWKLHGTLAEAKNLAAAASRCEMTAKVVDVALAPPFTALTVVRDALVGSSVALAAQDAYWEDRGAFTGAVSAALLADIGCRYVIVGHSERRRIFGDADADVRRKAAAVLRHGMSVVICVGERLEEREAGATLDRVLDQVVLALDGHDQEALARVVIAYEPIWAIGTGRNAEPGDAQSVQRAIREAVAARASGQLAAAMRIVYGGSVNANNAASLMAQPDVDGLLVGGASLDAGSFCAIVRAAG